MRPPRGDGANRTVCRREASNNPMSWCGRKSLDPRAGHATAVAERTGTAGMGSLEEPVPRDTSRSDRLIPRAPSAPSTDVAQVPDDVEAAATGCAPKGAAAGSGSRTRPRSLRLRNWLIDRVVGVFALVLFVLSFLYRGHAVASVPDDAGLRENAGVERGGAMRRIVGGTVGVVWGAVLLVASLTYGLPPSDVRGVEQLAAGFFGIALCILGWTLLRRPRT